MKAVGRNDPCPCRSGHKFKKCCGRPEGTKLRSFDGTYLRLRIGLRHSDPEVWRLILLRSDAWFEDLHQAVQACGWEQVHLWNFVDPGGPVLAGPPSQDSLLGNPQPDARRVQLASFFSEIGATCVYRYDFGDGWEHDIVLEGIEQHTETFDRVLLDGAQRFPPEDCGGPPGFARLREFVATGIDPWNDEDSVSLSARSWQQGQWDLVAERARFDTVLPSLATPTVESTTPTSPPAVRTQAAGAQPARTQALDHHNMAYMIDRLQQTATEIGQKLGVQIQVGKASYSDLNAKITVEVATVREDGIVMDRMATDFIDRCEDFGLEPSDLGAVFRCSEGNYRVIGMRPRAKAPVICEKVREGYGVTSRVRVGAAFARSRLRGEVVVQPALRLLPPQPPGNAQA
jgi:hypothetical protein